MVKTLSLFGVIFGQCLTTMHATTQFEFTALDKIPAMLNNTLQSMYVNDITYPGYPAMTTKLTIDVDSLFNINLSEAAQNQDFISAKHNEFLDTGILYFHDMLSETGLNYFNHMYSKSKSNMQTIYNKITIYPFDCPDNQQNATVSWVEQSTKSSFLWSHKLSPISNSFDFEPQFEFEEIYHHSPLRTLLSSIILNSYKNSDSLHYVYDDDSHFYFHVQRGSPFEEFTAWHYDEHHFTCAVLIKPSEFGGQFNYLQYRNVSDNKHDLNKNHLENEQMFMTAYDNWWNDDKLEKILNMSKVNGVTDAIFQENVRDHDHIKSVQPNQGDMYCFFGNESLHSVTQITGHETRVSLIMSMAFGEKFIHTGGAVTSLSSNDSYIKSEL